MAGEFKRAIAYKLKIGDIFKGKQIFDDMRFNFLELGDKRISRVNIVANVVEKFTSEEKQYMALTIDDASGQIRIKIFGDDVVRFNPIAQGDSVLVIGLLRAFNNEVYINPEIIKKQNPRYLMVRKLEFEKMQPKKVDSGRIIAVAEQILKKIKESEPDGIGTEKLILGIKESPDLINQEIKKALEQGIIYEPRPGIVRWLGMD